VITAWVPLIGPPICDYRRMVVELFRIGLVSGR
jgi:hypothetical protein